MAILAQQAPRDVDIDSLTKDLEAVPGVLSVHELHIWQLVESKYVGSCHVICQESLSLQEIATTIKNVFHEHKIHASTVQVEYAGQSSSEVRSSLFDCVAKWTNFVPFVLIERKCLHCFLR